jgi:hypothetical protein
MTTKARTVHERVLALSFMHGARQRLDSRLREINGLSGRYRAVTVDSFAWRLVQRWRRLAASLGHAIPPVQRHVRTRRSAPDPACCRIMGGSLVSVDVGREAQDLSGERSIMIGARTSAPAVDGREITKNVTNAHDIAAKVFHGSFLEE